jgi:hypothetical protein
MAETLGKQSRWLDWLHQVFEFYFNCHSNLLKILSKKKMKILFVKYYWILHKMNYINRKGMQTNQLEN